MSETPKPGARQFADLATLTPARVALGRSGASLPTREMLRFGMAHAQARDAVHAPFHADDVAGRLAALGPEVIQVDSAAGSREEYLRRPDLGRRLSPGSREALTAKRGAFDLAIVAADGLSSTAIHQNVVPFVAALLPLLARQGLRLAPLVIGREARVALGDEIGAALGVRAVAMLIGERPGEVPAEMPIAGEKPPIGEEMIAVLPQPVAGRSVFMTKRHSAARRCWREWVPDRLLRRNVAFFCCILRRKCV